MGEEFNLDTENMDDMTDEMWMRLPRAARVLIIRLALAGMAQFVTIVFMFVVLFCWLSLRGT